jgi:ligand-binding sensor domain-containing protein
VNGDPIDNRPVRRDDQLPIVVPSMGPEHDAAPADQYPRWSNVACQRQARCVTQGPDGAVWIATGGGILRWSPTMERYTRYASEHGLPGNATAAVAVDVSGRAWAISDTSKLHFLDDDVWQLYAHLRDSLISCLTVDNSGQLWAAGTDGVWRLGDPVAPPLQPLAVPHDSSLTISPPRALAVADSKDIWFANARGLYHCDGHDWKGPLEIPDSHILTLLLNGRDLWLGTLHGLLRIDLRSNLPMVNLGPGPDGPVTALAKVADSIWAAVGHTVGIADKANFHSISVRSESPIVDLANIDTGKVWIATHSGLLRGGQDGVQPQETGDPPDVIASFGAEEQLNTFSNMVQALPVQYSHDRSLLWIGTAKGLFRLDPASHQWRAYTLPGLQDVRALVQGASDQELWAASWDRGLHSVPSGILASDIPRAISFLAVGPTSDRWAVVCLDAEPDWGQHTVQSDGIYRNTGRGWSLAISGSMLREAGLPPGERVQTVAQTMDGHLWIGTSAGLWSYDMRAQSFEGRDLLAGSPEVRVVLALPAFGVLCIGTSHGLFAGEPGNLLSLPNFVGHAITALAWDSNAARLWVGTEAGLLQLEHKASGWQEAHHYTVANSGLAADYITSLALIPGEEHETYVWIGTPCGLSLYCDHWEGSTRE